MTHQDKWDGGQHGNGLKIFGHIKRHLRVKTGIGCKPARSTYAQYVAVWGGFGNHTEANVAASSGPVVNDQGLTQFVVEPCRQNSNDGICTSARRKRDHNFDGF